MKEVYQTPKMEIIEFEQEDIITASGDVSALGFGGASENW